LRKLVDAGNQPGLHASALKKTDIRTPWTDASPYVYDPYPDYNTDAWKASNKGIYVPCPGPEETVRDVMVFRGRSEAFHESPIGSYDVLQMDNALCFERDTRLGMYTDQEGEMTPNKGVNWDAVNWGALQDFCYEKNSDRYVQLEKIGSIEDEINPHKKKNDQFDPIEDDSSRGYSRDVSNPHNDSTHSTRPKTIADESVAKPKSRTALLLRAYSGKKYTENDKQNIRSLVSELSLRSGGEYQVFLLVQIKNGLPFTEESLHADLPKEFWDMAVPWNDEQMSELYPLIPPEVNNVHQSQWFSVQKFALDYPEFDFYWNWELDSRFTGHHYDLLERLSAFAYKQPRKGLWERNERYYIPSVHGHYDTTFRSMVEEVSGSDTVWGPVHLEGVSPVGSPPPVANPADDNYEWGVGEEADYISLGPMFNPVGASWIDGKGVWGYAGADNTPRRATIGTQSRCSRKLLNAMHGENLKGNHVGSEMTPQTVALLHGLKAVYAPIPMFFDRAWSGQSLNKWFNPGPKGESGSTPNTPFGWGLEARFEGSSWYYRTTLPMRLYNNFLGWEDSGIGGLEVCFFLLPPGVIVPVLMSM
jgi:hypothetical protein